MLGNSPARGVRETNRYCAALLVNKTKNNYKKIKHGKKPHTDRTATVDRCITLCYKNWGNERGRETESESDQLQLLLQLIQSIDGAELMQLT